MTSCSYCGQTQPTLHPCHACAVPALADDATRLVEQFGEDDESDVPEATDRAPFVGPPVIAPINWNVPVWIDGPGMSGVTSVTVAGKSVPFVYCNDGSISFRIPGPTDGMHPTSKLYQDVLASPVYQEALAKLEANRIVWADYLRSVSIADDIRKAMVAVRDDFEPKPHNEIVSPDGAKAWREIEAMASYTGLNESTRSDMIAKWAEEDASYNLAAFDAFDRIRGDYHPAPRPDGYRKLEYHIHHSYAGQPAVGYVSVYCADGLTREYSATPGQPWRLTGEHP